MAEHAIEWVRRMSTEQGLLPRLRSRAAARGARVVLPEGEDPRTVSAACVLREFGIANPILIGPAARLRASLSEQGVDPGVFELVDPEGDARVQRVGERLFERRRGKGLSQGEALVLARDPLQLGAGMVALGQAEAMVAGAAHPTSAVIRAGLYHAGLAEGIRVVSGSFLMVPPEGHSFPRPLLFADAGVVPAPSEEELVSIGRSSAATYERLMGTAPRIACLSFSTKGSADHPRAEMMARVAAALREGGLVADGELQLDAALIPEVARGKAPDSQVAGRADVLLFPDLDAGNIGYKLTQRLGGFQAIGPLVQGLAYPIFDLSRGANVGDIVNTASLAILCRDETGA